ncbi:unnamed protein product [Soboliphyme baturini]|uniref:Peptidase S1 domain-containing protein n=1 Tax=Soboliphyme baturini TaxID=241478 RepID=A0A183IIX3_9BILA|nr:unnamed protein product [Soboliphyme baturini]
MFTQQRRALSKDVTVQVVNPPLHLPPRATLLKFISECGIWRPVRRTFLSQKLSCSLYEKNNHQEVVPQNVLLNPFMIRVTAGAVDLSAVFETGRTSRIISKYLVHANFVPNNPAYDIALLEIYPRVRWSPKIRPLCLPETPVQTMQHCYMYGYGSTMRIDSRPSSTLKYATLAILNQSVCLRHFQYNSRRLICTSSIDAHRTPTNGDFGGPVLCAESDGGYFWYAPRGIITEQINTRGCLHIHTDVTAFKNWISVAAGQLNSLPPNSRSKLGLNPYSLQVLT